MKNQPLISVIIPTYKSELCIGRCLDSILNQTYHNLEIIIVDDCSPDNTLRVLREYKNRDSRIHYYSLEKNSGTVSAGRNYALTKAKGEFCTFADHDDYLLKENAIETMYKALIESKADLAICQASIFSLKTQRFEDRNWNFSGDSREWITHRSQMQDLLNFNQWEFYSVMVWNKLFKMSLIKQHNIIFPDKLIYEDVMFSWHYLLVATQGSVRIQDVFYLWHAGDNNLSSQHETYYQIFITYKMIYKYFEEYGYFQFAKDKLDEEVKSKFYHFVNTSPINRLGLNFFKEARKFFKEEGFPLTYSKKDRIGTYLLKINPFFAYFYFALIKDPQIDRLLIVWNSTFIGKGVKNFVLFFIYIPFMLYKLLKIFFIKN